MKIKRDLSQLCISDVLLVGHKFKKKNQVRPRQQSNIWSRLLVHRILSDLIGRFFASHAGLYGSSFNYLPYINSRKRHFKYYLISCSQTTSLKLHSLGRQVLTLQGIHTPSYRKLMSPHWKSSFPQHYVILVPLRNNDIVCGNRLLIPSNFRKKYYFFTAHML